MSNDTTSPSSQGRASATGQRTTTAGAPKKQATVQRRASAPGKRSLVQMRYGGAASSDAVHDIASRGVQGTGSTLPHLPRIQQSFGRHDVSGVQAHSSPGANAALGSEAYAMGNDIAFTGIPSLHTAAHEAAHVVQQRAGVHLKGGVGESGDAYEQHADAVADRVVAGQSAESLLDTMAGGGGGGDAGVQRKAVQFWSGHEHRAMGNMGAMIATGDANFNVADFVRRHGNRDFTDPAAMGFTNGAEQSPDPVLRDINRRGRGAVSVRTNDTYVGGSQYAPPTRVENSISFGAASEYGGDYDTNVRDLARENTIPPATTTRWWRSTPRATSTTSIPSPAPSIAVTIASPWTRRGAAIAATPYSRKGSPPTSCRTPLPRVTWPRVRSTEPT